MTFNLERLKIEASIDSLYRQKISNLFENSFDVTVDFVNIAHPIDQHLDVATSAAIAAVIVGIGQMVLTVLGKAESTRWTLDHLKAKVRQTAAEIIGTDELLNIEFEGLKPFLENRQDSCRVIADIRDEVYSFIVFRTGNIVVIKHENE